MMTNDTFRGGSRCVSWANACVGNNGNPNQWTYARGYAQSAKLIIDSVLQDEGRKHSVDEYVYPVCFNLRHAVELYLKGIVEHYRRICELKGVKINFELSITHDINLLWEFIIENSCIVDKRYILFLDKINPTIKDVGEIDPTGQTFRYPTSTESKKHLVESPLINFIILKDKFEFLYKILEVLYKMGIYLIREYECGTFTKNLSRQQIWEISHKLPNKNSWKNLEFTTLRDELKFEYKISSREFSKAIDLIKVNYEFSYLIGVEVELLGINKSDLISIFDEHIKLYPISVYSDDEADDNEVIIQFGDTVVFDKHLTCKVNAVNTLLPNINEQVLAGLAALFYFAMDAKFSEEYIRRYEDELMVVRSERNLERGFCHLFEKTILIGQVLRSLFFLCKVDLAEEIIVRYELEDKFDWIESARNGELYEKPEYCGYS